MSIKIVLDANGKRELAKIFGITPQNVGLALSYKRNSSQSEKIRKMALQKGGKMVEILEVTEKPVKMVKILDNRGRVKAERNL